MFSDDHYTLLKPLSTSVTSDMTYHILVFLDASPLSLFIGAPEDGAEWVYRFEEVFASLMQYLVADDERIRHLANTVARKVMSEGGVALRRKVHTVSSQAFRLNFWRLTYVYSVSTQ